MRIFCAVRHANDPNHFYGGLWSANFYPALRQLGHEVVESQVDLLPTSRFMGIADGFTPEEVEVRARGTDKILSEVREAHKRRPVDLFLCYFYNSHFDPAGFEDLRSLGIPSVNFYCNSIYQFSNVAAIAARADFSWHAERDARPRYLAVGGKPIWVQMGADPQVYCPVSGVMRADKICFIGQRYADRSDWMAALIRASLPVDIYGPGWGAATEVHEIERPEPDRYLGREHPVPGSRASYMALLRSIVLRHGLLRGGIRAYRQLCHRRKTRRLQPLFSPYAKGAVPFQKIARIFSSYELILNFSNVWADGLPGSALIPHVRLRDFEAPMCRTCYLTGHTDEITGFYEVGQEIDTYHTREELVDKARFYLAHPDLAERMRERGHRRALRDHTWECRFRELFLKIGLN